MGDESVTQKRNSFDLSDSFDRLATNLNVTVTQEMTVTLPLSTIF
jgi:hypothetical protein